MDETSTDSIAFMKYFSTIIDGISPGLSNSLAEDVEYNWFGYKYRGKNAVLQVLGNDKTSSLHIFSYVVDVTGIDEECDILAADIQEMKFEAEDAKQISSCSKDAESLKEEKDVAMKDDNGYLNVYQTKEDETTILEEDYYELMTEITAAHVELAQRNIDIRRSKEKTVSTSESSMKADTQDAEIGMKYVIAYGYFKFFLVEVDECDSIVEAYSLPIMLQCAYSQQSDFDDDGMNKQFVPNVKYQIHNIIYTHLPNIGKHKY